MHTRRFLETENLLPTDLVTLVLEILPMLDLVDLERLILLTEMEVQYRTDV